MSVKPATSKGANVFAAIVFIIFFGLVFLVGRCTVNMFKGEPAPEAKPWAEMSYEQKEVWLKYYLNHLDNQGYQLLGMTEQAVKARFNYPNSVAFDFGKAPNFSLAVVSDPEEGVVVIVGSGTAKNAFGMESTFNYSARYTITTDKKVLEDVNVN